MIEKVYSIGIDVSKKTLDVCFLGDKKKNLKLFKIPNTLHGINKIMNYLGKYELDNDISCTLESTSSYHVLASLILSQQGLCVKVFNPVMFIKYFKSDIRNCKTDKLDARRIAEIGLLEDIPPFKLTEKQFIIKKKISILQTITKQKQALKASVKQFAEDHKTVNMDLVDSYECMEKTIKSLNKTIKQLEKEIQQELENQDIFNKLSHIKGVSPESAAIILAIIADKEFQTKFALMAFAGLDVTVKQSGTSINKKGRISKRGNSMLRQTLTSVAWGLMMHNPVFKALASYHKQQGRHYSELRVIIAKKFLKIVYGMLKSGSPFNPALVKIPI